MAKIYINEIQKLSEDTNNSQLINIQEILKLPDVLNIQLDQEAEELIWNELQIVLSEAIDNFINMRKKEGKKIQEDLENRISEK